MSTKFHRGECWNRDVYIMSNLKLTGKKNAGFPKSENKDPKNLPDG